MVIERLNADPERALPLPEVKDVLGKQCLVAAATSPQGFDAFMRTEMGGFERAIKTLKLEMN